MTDRNDRPPLDVTLQWPSRRERFVIMIKSIAWTLFGFIVLDVIFLIAIWPNWQELQSGAIPKSQYMKDYLESRDDGRQRFQWQPLSGELSSQLTRPFIIAEDSRFYEHPGIDLQAIQEAIKYNWNQGRWALGASTISQQTVKNLFLSHEKSFLRKWHELLLTLVMESKLRKTQIIRIYLNIAEFGPGIFGVEAASWHYYGQSFRSLGVIQVAELAATLPGPKSHNPRTRTQFFKKKRERILAVINYSNQELDKPNPLLNELLVPEEEEEDEDVMTTNEEESTATDEPSTLPPNEEASESSSNPMNSENDTLPSENEQLEGDDSQIMEDPADDPPASQNEFDRPYQESPDEENLDQREQNENP